MALCLLLYFHSTVLLSCHKVSGRSNNPVIVQNNLYYFCKAFFPLAFYPKCFLTLLHSERPKLHTILAFLSAIGLKDNFTASGIEMFLLFFLSHKQQRCTSAVYLKYFGTVNAYMISEFGLKVWVL